MKPGTPKAYTVDHSLDWTPRLIMAACALLDLSIDDVAEKVAYRMSAEQFQSLMKGRKPTSDERRTLEVVLGDCLGKIAVIKVADKGMAGVVFLLEPFPRGTPMVELESLAREYRGED